mgnify:CR=1 FL=1
MNDKIRQLEEVIAYSDEENKWIKLYFDKVKFPNGSTGRYNRIVEKDGKPAAAILPIKRGKIGLVNQYRYPIDRFLWEIPRGFGESYETLEEAKRELEEETGFVAEQATELGIVHPDSGILASKVQLFAVVLDQAQQQPELLDNEVNVFQWFYAEEIYSQIAQAKITDVFTICAVFRARERGLIH